MSKKKNWKKRMLGILPVIIGAAGGLLIAEYIHSRPTGNETAAQQLLSLAAMLLAIFAAFFLQIIIHELGHLVFGLLTGYRYSSFRIAGFMWVKEDGHLKMKRLSIAGTGGQCLLIPPEPASDGSTPFLLYHLGGPLANAISALIFLALFLAFKSVMLLSAFFLLLAVCGFASALLNGIPMNLSLVGNDGYNALLFAKNPHALHAFSIQMKIVEQTSLGVRLKDMPEAWFTVPPPEKMTESISAALGVFACNRLLDAQLFEQADALMAELLEQSALAGIHRSLLLCDRIYCALIGDRRQEILDIMEQKEQKKFMKAMKKFPTVLRTAYAYALLADNTPEKAAKIMADFVRIAPTYPYPSDIAGEYELIDLATQAAAKP
jgi:Peptidase family M50.